jgi:hypothetical protein
MGLVLKEKICVASPQGTSEVQLLFGDITKLPMEEKVDYLFTSAFPGKISLEDVGARKASMNRILYVLQPNRTCCSLTVSIRQSCLAM